MHLGTNRGEPDHKIPSSSRPAGRRSFLRRVPSRIPSIKAGSFLDGNYLGLYNVNMDVVEAIVPRVALVCFYEARGDNINAIK